MNTRFVRSHLWILLLLLGLNSFPAQASEHEGAAAAPAPLQFLVNLGKTGRGQSLLQVSMVLKPANPEFGQQLVAYKPQIQHTIIQLLCAASEESLRTEDGKTELAEGIKKAINSIFHVRNKSGVREVLFTQFMIAQS